MLLAGLCLSLGSSLVLANDGLSRVYVGFQPGKAGEVMQTLRAAGAKTHHRFDALGAVAVSVPEQALNGLRNNPNVLYVEEDPKRHLMAQSTPYGIPLVQADDLSLQPASASHTVCIIDSGYDLGHEDLPSSNVTGVNDPGTGTWYTDQNGHGTHVAGTIAALDNTTGVVGVFRDQNVKLHIIKVFGADGWAYSSSLVAAATRCEDAGANVINMSLGGTVKSRTEERYFEQATARGVLPVAAAGNDGNTRYSYPASYPSVVSVGGVDAARNLYTGSQRNDQVDIVAPAVLVQSTVPTGTGSEASVSVGSNGFAGIAMEGSALGTAGGPLVDCGLGAAACPGGGGQVCLIQRGTYSFAEKVQACEAGGGSAAVIYNNETGGFAGTLGGITTGIPSLGVSDSDGAALLALLGQNASVTVAAGNYAFFDGTSMATPHVAGIAALLWSNFPACTNEDIRTAILSTAEDLGSAGRDNSFGHGLIQARAAYDFLAASACGGGGGDPDPEPGDITLSASGYKVKGVKQTDLSWSGASGASVDIWRDGTLLVTTVNDGAHTDVTGLKGSASHVYKVCEAGTSSCSADVTATY